MRLTGPLLAQNWPRVEVVRNSGFRSHRSLTAAPIESSVKNGPIGVICSPSYQRPLLALGDR
jgi:hypothetical protein